jgi:hypothetical protein
VIIIVVGNFYGGNWTGAGTYAADLAFLYVYFYLVRFFVIGYGFIGAD